MKHIRDCFNAQFKAISLQVTQIQALNQQIHQYLPEILKNQCWVIGFQSGNLTLGTTNSSWATQLRYFLPELRDQLRTKNNLYQLSSIKIVVDSNHHQQQSEKTEPEKKTKPQSPWHNILQSLLISVHNPSQQK